MPIRGVPHLSSARKSLQGERVLRVVLRSGRIMTTHGFAFFDTAIGRCGIAWGERGIVAVQHGRPAISVKTLSRILRLKRDP
jgi:hypothetical protein